MVGRTQRLAVAGLLLASVALTGCEYLDMLDTAKSHAKLVAVPPSYTGPGPVTVHFNGSIHADGPCDVKYRIVRSDGISTPLEKLDFDHSGTKNVSKAWTFTTAWTGWAKLQVESPEWTESKPALFKANIHAVSVTLAAIPPFHKGPGAFPVNFQGVIATTKPMDVTYTFVRSDGSPSVAVTKNFPTAGPHPVSEVHVFVPPSVGWWKLKVISPETVESPPATYQVIP